MRTLVICALLLAPLAPARAADLDGPAADRSRAAASVGAFAGFRARLALGPTRERVSAGVALAPARGANDGDGRVDHRIGGGVELGLTGNRLGLTIAGRRPNAIRLGVDRDEGGDDRGPSTALLIAGGVLLAAGIGALVFVDALNDASE